MRFASCLILLTAAWTTPAAENCFSAADSKDVSFEVLWQVPPPMQADDPHYAHYPTTGAASQDLAKLNGTRAGSLDLYYFLWANRCHDLGFNAGVCGWNKKGNVVFPKLETAQGEVRTFFSSFERANDCTLAQAARVLGYPATKTETYAKRSGITLVSKGPDVLRHVKDNRLVDVCLLEKEALRESGRGILLDYEVQDRRTPAQTLAFLQEFTALVHGAKRQAMLLTNPFDAPTQKWTGVADTNAHQIYEAFDRTLLFMWHNNRQKDLGESIRHQLQMMRNGGAVDGRRLTALFELSNTTMAEAQLARKTIQGEHMTGVLFWRNYAKTGGDCGSDVNRKIACLVFGRCE